jgi:cell wall-associated NlpC family hydrolase
MLADQIISAGLLFLGTPYQFNARSYQTDVFDCSSFVQYIFGVNGISLPRNSRQQFTMGTRIPLSHIRKGDLLFFTTKKRANLEGINKIGHVAVYIGKGKILHTYRQGKSVQVSELDSYWRSKLLEAKRVI